MQDVLRIGMLSSVKEEDNVHTKLQLQEHFEQTEMESNDAYIESNTHYIAMEDNQAYYGQNTSKISIEDNVAYGHLRALNIPMKDDPEYIEYHDN